MAVQDIDGLYAEAKLWIEFRYVVVGPVVEFRIFCYWVFSLAALLRYWAVVEFRCFLLF